MVKLFSKLYCKLIPFRWTYHLWESLKKKYETSSSKIVSCETTSKFNHADRSEWNYEDVEETIRVPFENMKFNIPKNYDNCLRKCYGDYMVLPSLEQRTAHHSDNVFYDPFRPYMDYQNSKKLKRHLLLTARKCTKNAK